MGVFATDYVRGELDAATQRRYEDHIASCPRCRIEVEEVKETVALLCAAPAPVASEPDPGLPQRVLARIPGREWTAARPARRYRSFAFASASAAALLLAAFTLLFFRARGDGGAPEKPGRAGLSGSAAAPSAPGRREEASVISRARSWLVSAQEPDGSWDPRKWGGSASFRVALTGFALLALSGDDRGSSGEACCRATGYLLRSQEESGIIGEASAGSLYNHAIATLALIEARGSSSAKEAAIERAVSVLQSAQTPSGAWGCIRDAEADAALENESTSIWALQALVRAAALDYETDARAIERGFQWFERNLGREGMRGGAHTGWARHVCGQDSLRFITAWAVVLRDRKGAPAADTRLAADHIVRVTLSERCPLTFYESYFLLRTLAALETPSLERVRARTTRSLVDSQVREGSLAGSWEPKDRWSPVGGRLYSTALAALALESSET
ncbi:MAG: zf-HC2 domain-containing protein [Planctomycetes bacterium]|nr:zf-HC2 domain-containing protein [Planctomycetota bacterium]